MDANEKKVAEALASSADDIEVPASLTPEAVQARLTALEAAEAAGNVGTTAAPVAPQRPRRRRWLVPTVAAACLVLLCGVGVLAANATGLLAPFSQGDEREAIEATYNEQELAAAREVGVLSDVPVAESYEQLHELVVAEEMAPMLLYEDGAEMAIAEAESDAVATDAVEDAAAVPAARSETQSAGGDFSQTNVRTEGVDEADVVKTDGQALFALQHFGNQISIIAADAGQMEEKSVIESTDYEDFCELYVSENRLYVVENVYGADFAGDTVTRVITYDVSDLSNPQQVAAFEQSGYYHSSRMAGGYLYLFTDFYPEYGASVEEVDRYVPSVAGDVLPCDDVFVPTCGTGMDYLVVSSVSLDAPDTAVARKALAGAGSVYVSADSIYVYGAKRVPVDGLARAAGEVGGAVDESEAVILPAVAEDDESTAAAEDPMADEAAADPEAEDGAPLVEEVEDDEGTELPMEDLLDEDIAIDIDEPIADVWYPAASNSTVICKLSYGAGAIEPVGEVEVPGFVDDAFAIDEYEGNTRVITTLYGENGSMSNNVFVLDAQLQEIGSLTDLAPDERVYSARLMGPIGYFVTYRETDPLFSVDFSDPTNPRVLGELKIPGFSEYLHPWGEGRLLGIGMATSGDGMITDGMKLSMFDVSDPANVREETTFVMNDIYWSQALYEYRAVFVDVERGLVGFSAEGENESYYLFTFNEADGFAEVIRDEMEEWTYNGARGVRIREVFYVVGEGVATSYGLGDFAEIARVGLSGE